MNILTTTRTYATYENAEAALDRTLTKLNANKAAIRYLIAATADGRYAPVVLGAENALLAHHGITVVG